MKAAFCFNFRFGGQPIRPLDGLLHKYVVPMQFTDVSDYEKD
jgi:hypothetical protein